MFRRIAKNNYDWLIFFGIIPIVAAGLVTMYSFDATSLFFTRQIIWVGIAFIVFVLVSTIDVRFLRETRFIMLLYGVVVALLLLLFILGSTFKGATSWFDLGFLAFQPSDPAKLVLILVLAKYFSRRHVEIRDFRHIFISGLYALIIFILIFLQPDFGSSIIILAIWFGMVLVSGISKKHIAILFGVGAVAFIGLWTFVLDDFQKERVESFLHPYADISGDGYNAYQSAIAVGSGELTGKGIGYGTQSRLQFLPEYESDFIFAAFTEEWGYIGALLLFFFFGVVIWRIFVNAKEGATNFETFFAVGLATMFIAHFTVHVGTNIGMLPVTGLTMPFMSYGGSHLLTEFLGLGILMSMRQYRRESKEVISQPDLLEE
ncbi:rod shape-determining protein RodA [Fodinibius sp.]|uniref:rod shape-determining protein RodA n=1 Tax=Fodinibius sp. TaxID=1872440 RepID=UPI002ACD68AA|nr:rod shape-determining protein RodA [Fodinibius sp.]MDZ7660326.1 rod shape-determining protein RodA [Fodinibius sp.]